MQTDKSEFMEIKYNTMKKILFVIMMLGVPFGMNAQKSDVTRETTVYSVIGKDTLKMDTYIKSGAEVPPKAVR